MFLFNSLNLLLDGRRGDDSRSHGSGSGQTELHDGELSSSAWEGWWYEEAA